MEDQRWTTHRPQAADSAGQSPRRQAAREEFPQGPGAVADVHIWAGAPPRCMPCAGKVVSRECCELPRTAAADPEYHRRPEKAIMRDLAAGKFGGFQKGKSYWRSAAALHLCTTASATARGSVSPSKIKTQQRLNLRGGHGVPENRMKNMRVRPMKTAGDRIRFLLTAVMQGQTSVTLAEPRLEGRGASASAFALAAVHMQTHTGGKFPARKIPLEESVSTFLHF